MVIREVVIRSRKKRRIGRGRKRNKRRTGYERGSGRRAARKAGKAETDARSVRVRATYV